MKLDYKPIFKVVLLGMDDLGDQISDDYLLEESLQKRGVGVHNISWEADCDWSNFDLVLVRSTWDYHLRWNEFLPKLKEIANQTLLLNPFEVIQWNTHKSYLKELKDARASVMPTIFSEKVSKQDLLKAFDHFHSDKIVIKPLISANSLNTIIVHQNHEESLDQALSVFSAKEAMIQPFVDSIKTEGEYSLYFYQGKLSHTIVKKPAKGDFRVQEDFGGIQEEVIPNEALISTAKKALNACPYECFYARVDLINYFDTYYLMELELIEPGMYFRFCPGSADNFAEAILERLS